MPEKFFRYVPVRRAPIWEAAGWSIISPPLAMKPPGGGNQHIDVVIVEWQKSGEPIEPRNS